MYQSIILEGPQKDIESISKLVEVKEFTLGELYPVPENIDDVGGWKRAHWGTDKPLSEVYVNSHPSTHTVKASVMIGFEVDGSVVKWVEKVSRDYPDVNILLDVDNDGKESYRNVGKFFNGKRISNQLRLF